MKFFAIAALCVALGGCSRVQPASAQAEPAAVATVSIAKAASTKMSRGIVLTAEFIPFQEVEVMAIVAGYV